VQLVIACPFTAATTSYTSLYGCQPVLLF